MKAKLAIAFVMLLLTACTGIRAEVAPMTTPQPPPAPQVIVVQQPAPTPAPANDDSGVVIVAVLSLMVLAAMGSGIAIGYIARRPAVAAPPANDAPQSLTITTHHHYPSAPAQLTPFEQYQLLKQQGFASHLANQIVSEGRAYQYLLPPGQ